MSALCQKCGVVLREESFCKDSVCPLRGAAQPVQQPAAVVGQEPFAYVRQTDIDTPVGSAIWAYRIAGQEWSVPICTAPVPAAGVQGDRFYIDHGLWHDRVTGQHMWTQDQYDDHYRDGLSVGRENTEIAASAQPFQQRVQPWMMACFGAEISADKAERNHRFFEEATELVQSTGMTASEAHQLVDYVFGRDIGEPAQEVGGVMVTLAALCLANNLDMHANAETELARIWTKVEAIRDKQAAKPKHSPLPQAAIVQPDSGRDAALEEAAGALEILCYGAENGAGGTVAERLRQAQRTIRALAAHPAPSSDAAQESAISAAMAEGNRHGVNSTVAARIVAAYIAAHPANGAQAGLSDEPDMLWDAEDTEGTYGNGAEDFARDYASGNMARGDISEITIQCAKRLPDRMMRIEVTSDEENWLKWEWMTAAAPQKKEG